MIKDIPKPKCSKCKKEVKTDYDKCSCGNVNKKACLNCDHHGHHIVKNAVIFTVKTCATEGCKKGSHWEYNDLSKWRRYDNRKM